MLPVTPKLIVMLSIMYIFNVKLDPVAIFTERGRNLYLKIVKNHYIGDEKRAKTATRSQLL